MTLADWLRAATQRLAAISDTPRLDAELLAAHALGLERNQLILRLRDLTVPAGLDELLARRLGHEPIAQITGARDFWTLTLKVTADVLTPRPDSETLIEAAIDHFTGTTGPRHILDLGTGSGALLLAALDHWPKAEGLGIDLSPAALAVAQENGRITGLEGRALFREGDWGTGLTERFDLILCNPPYIRDDAMLPRDVAEHEPALALFGGPDGLAPYRRLAVDLPGLLVPEGVACFEIGFDQGETAAVLFAERGFAVTLRRDLGGNARCLVVTRD